MRFVFSVNAAILALVSARRPVFIPNRHSKLQLLIPLIDQRERHRGLRSSFPSLAQALCVHYRHQRRHG